VSFAEIVAATVNCTFAAIADDVAKRPIPRRLAYAERASRIAGRGG
jgi:hypothetical protein